MKRNLRCCANCIFVDVCNETGEACDDFYCEIIADNKARHDYNSLIKEQIEDYLETLAREDGDVGWDTL